jgi:hypothetical protein
MLPFLRNSHLENTLSLRRRGFATRRLARELRSLVRVTRRVVESGDAQEPLPRLGRRDDGRCNEKPWVVLCRPETAAQDVQGHHHAATGPRRNAALQSSVSMCGPWVVQTDEPSPKKRPCSIRALSAHRETAPATASYKAVSAPATLSSPRFQVLLHSLSSVLSIFRSRYLFDIGLPTLCLTLADIYLPLDASLPRSATLLVPSNEVLGFLAQWADTFFGSILT